MTACWSSTAPAPSTIRRDRKSTRLNSSHSQISYAVFCLKKKKKTTTTQRQKLFRDHTKTGKLRPYEISDISLERTVLIATKQDRYTSEATDSTIAIAMCR